MDYEKTIEKLEAQNKLLQREIALLKETENDSVKKIMNSIPGFAFIKDISLNYVSANKTFCDLLNIPYDQIEGKTDYDIFPEDLADKYIVDDKKVIETGKPILVEEVTIDANKPNYRFTVATRKLPWRNEKGEIIGLYGLGFDISELKLMGKLKKSEERLKLIIKGSNDAPWDWDLITDELYYSPQWWSQIGYEPDELPADSGLWERLTHPEDKMHVGSAFADALKNGSESYAIEFRLKHKEGHYVPVLSRGYITRDNSGSPIRVTGTNMDLTERKKAEEKLLETQYYLSKAQEIGKLGSWELDIRNNVLKWTDEMYKIFGVKHGEPLTYEEFLDCVHPDDRDYVNHEWTTKMHTNNYDIQHRLMVDGKIKWVREKAEVSYDKNNEPLIAIGYTQDITLLKKTEIELVEAKEKAEESDRLKSAFLANMSHEIRTPMNGILGFTSLLKEKGLTGGKKQKYISIIEKSGNRMLDTINDIIDISKIEAGQVELSISTVDLNSQLNEFYEFFLPEAQKKNLELSVNAKLPNQYARFQSDKEKLNSIVNNLIKNAIKYTNSGSIEFGYVLSKDGKKDELHFCIKDTGIGIPKDKQNYVFERFVQAGSIEENMFEGSGLGLAISRAYVEMLGGRIWFESEEGTGTQFCFTLPFKSHRKNIRSGAIEMSDFSEPPKNSLKILIVEDEEFSIEYLSILLKSYAKQMLFAKTGTDALNICRDNRDIDLILMDIRIPELNGYKTTEEIRKFNKEVYIIAQTAYAQVGDFERSIEAGCNEYITKPVNKNRLLEIISSHFA